MHPLRKTPLAMSSTGVGAFFLDPAEGCARIIRRRTARGVWNSDIVTGIERAHRDRVPLSVYAWTSSREQLMSSSISRQTPAEA